MSPADYLALYVGLGLVVVLFGRLVKS